LVFLLAKKNIRKLVSFFHKILKSILDTSAYVYSFAASDTGIFAGTRGGGVFLSTNNGANWKAVNNGLTDKTVNSLAIQGSNLFAGTDGGSVFLSTNNCANWTEVNTKLSCLGILRLAVIGSNLYAATWMGGVWRRPLSEFPSSVLIAGNELPQNFSLMQNYPNPFNPSTTIDFSCLNRAVVVLEVFDISGRKVKTLLRGELTAGSHSIQWNGTDDSGRNVSAGVYVCRMRAGDFQRSVKLALVK
jgi:hypothetical protein